MRVLLLSNQGMTDGIVGNPIMLRMRDALKNDSRIEEVKMLRCKAPLSVRKKLRDYAKQADVIHIHFGGAYALLTWFLLLGIHIPKVITFHGTDIHAKGIKTAKTWKEKIRIRINQYASFMSIALFDKVGFVASDMEAYVPKCLHKQLEKKSFVQKLGVDYNTFVIEDKSIAQNKLDLKGDYIHVLFSDISDSSIKRRDIAEAIVKELGENYKLNIMCGVCPNLVPTYINASDFLLLTSDEEGSPNIIRESLSLNKPVFCVDVGDAKKQIAGLQNSSIISRDPKVAASVILEKLTIPYTDNTRVVKQDVLDLSILTRDIINIYQDLCDESTHS